MCGSPNLPTKEDFLEPYLPTSEVLERGSPRTLYGYIPVIAVMLSTQANAEEPLVILCTKLKFGTPLLRNYAQCTFFCHKKVVYKKVELRNSKSKKV